MEEYLYVTIDGETYATPNPEYDKILAQDKFDLYFEESDIPRFYYDIDFDNYVGDREAKSYRYIKHFADNITDPKFDYTNMYLYGLQNTQKTTMSANILKAGMREGLKTKFVGAGKLIGNLLKNQSFGYHEDVIKYLNNIAKCNILCIDDIFDSVKSVMWENPTSKPMILSAWDEFLRPLMSSKTKVIFTSNFNIESIKTSYGTSMYELIDRNCVTLELMDSVKITRKKITQDGFGGI